MQRFDAMCPVLIRMPSAFGWEVPACRVQRRVGALMLPLLGIGRKRNSAVDLGPSLIFAGRGYVRRAFPPKGCGPDRRPPAPQPLGGRDRVKRSWLANRASQPPQRRSGNGGGAP
jgi:hypothetical protein